MIPEPKKLGRPDTNRVIRNAADEVVAMRCCTCRVYKAAEAFAKDSTKPELLNNHCRLCDKTRIKARTAVRKLKQAAAVNPALHSYIERLGVSVAA